MKNKKYIIPVLIIITIVIMVIIRLISNKNSFDEELSMISKSNTTIPVITDTVKYKKVAGGFSINGAFSPYKEVSIAAETQGQINSINSKAGDLVLEGQVLASINNKINASELRLAEFNLEKSKKDVIRFEQLSENNAATMQQFETAKQVYETALSTYLSAKEIYDNSIIKAPFYGIITKRYIEKGSYLTSGTTAFDIVDISKLKFTVKLTAEEIEKVKKDEIVKVSADAYPGLLFDGKIKIVAPSADASKRFEVEVELNNRKDKLIRPGMFGAVQFENSSDKEQLIIPRNAIAGSIQNSEVFVIEGNIAKLRKIIPESVTDKDVIVKKGLKAGDIVVTSGQISLVDGSKIRLLKDEER
jgi:RND family efflux transporter MFP subunit